MSIKLLALDLDGTLVENLSTMAPETTKILTTVMKKGVHVTLATGREYKITAQFAERLNINTPIICYQGGLIQNHKNNTPLLMRVISAEISRQVIKFARVNKLPMLLYTIENPYVELSSTLMEDLFAQADSPFLVVNNLLSAVDDTQLPLKFLFVQPPHKTNTVYTMLQQKFGQNLTVPRSLETMVEATLPNTSKGDALRYLADALNIPLSQTMAIGDQDNDITMLKVAGLGVAMGNASAAAKKAATVIAPPITAKGALWAIKKYILEIE